MSSKLQKFDSRVKEVREEVPEESVKMAYAGGGGGETSQMSNISSLMREEESSSMSESINNNRGMMEGRQSVSTIHVFEEI